MTIQHYYHHLRIIGQLLHTFVKIVKYNNIVAIMFSWLLHQNKLQKRTFSWDTEAVFYIYYLINAGVTVYLQEVHYIWFPALASITTFEAAQYIVTVLRVKTSPVILQN